MTSLYIMNFKIESKLILGTLWTSLSVSYGFKPPYMTPGVIQHIQFIF